MGEDMIPPKLVSLSADELSVPLTDAINSSIRNCKFPDNGKRIPMPYLETLSIFIAAYRERYGTHYALIRLIEDGRLKLDND